MNLSERLLTIARFIPKCNCLADIGTDHGYIPIYTVTNNISQRAIASDINKGPVEIAKKNIKLYSIEGKIDTRVGNGLSTLKEGEADVILIAGMGGNLISEILEKDKNIAESADYLILQPVQYPEELRKYLCSAKFKILDEELAKEGNKYYHIIKVRRGEPDIYSKEVYYYTGLKLIEKRHPVLQSYVKHKIERITIILDELKNSDNLQRKNELKELKEEFEEVNKWLEAAEK